MQTESKNYGSDTVRIRRPARITTDEIGRNTWMGDVDPYPFELVTEENCDPYDNAATNRGH